jgi:hypothetical protein
MFGQSVKVRRFVNNFLSALVAQFVSAQAGTLPEQRWTDTHATGILRAPRIVRDPADSVVAAGSSTNQGCVGLSQNWASKPVAHRMLCGRVKSRPSKRSARERLRPRNATLELCDVEAAHRDRRPVVHANHLLPDPLAIDEAISLR